ncbi:DUF1822 family protein [Rivularia sp. UHCC 0363]|uniref:DUF1822 family protein n=1 Tax=Rivularia sp. UHCC 0363 TaxID=3110244 RepID=UPI002B206BF2|nr:DUF1822 family protein [Rivularia sp. UHCC 0363]MEA5598409.1 DUF1822 family protein [Rivularia sp. UHCC 0363]
MNCDLFADPKEWLLEITPEIQSRSRQQSQDYSNSSSRWCAYINQICLYAFLNWVQTQYVLQASIWYSSPDIPAFWEFVNGTAILLNERRVVLIPSEAIDDGELEVPQEWVDIPSWTADFYLAVQVKPDGEWVRFWSYTTHQELKTAAIYDPVDRTYCLDAQHLTKDLNAFWMADQFCRAEEIKADIPALSELSTTQAENMLQRLGRNSAIFTRLEMPFSSWGALLEKEQWRKKLYQQRQQSQPQLSPSVNLSAWLQGIYETSWQAIENFNSNSNSLAFNFRSSGSLNAAKIKRAKVIDLGVEAQSRKFLLLVTLISSPNQEVGIRVQLHPLEDEYLTGNIILVLLSELDEIIQEVRAKVQDNYIQLKLFEGEVGECFYIQVILDNYQITEKFLI